MDCEVMGSKQESKTLLASRLCCERHLPVSPWSIIILGLQVMPWLDDLIKTEINKCNYCHKSQDPTIASDLLIKCNNDKRNLKENLEDMGLKMGIRLSTSSMNFSPTFLWKWRVDLPNRLVKLQPWKISVVWVAPLKPLLLVNVFLVEEL